ncbi:MAG: Sua5/YciO/YrdC/YwlC family protein [Candidatus Nanopelagicales bacterium]|jgi:tRNA threonylcarbamoyl adenosine modification protein (Sua5/YciO/YrdC/YwlC family)|nr:Sua5/YciO/YrdC/YwlC family protein [Candidatus Nanopelagicales bacterium]
MRTYAGDDAVQRAAGTRAATTAMRSGRLVLAPADLHYAVVADAFSMAGVARLREARQVPEGAAVPVFIDRRTTLHALWGRVPRDAEVLARRFWPGPLTLIGKPQLSLAWDAGVSDAVAIRMPLHPWMLALVAAVGPLAATGAQAAGQPQATTLDQCDQTSISIGLDAGELEGGLASTVVDLRSGVEVVREGAIGAEAIMESLR